MSDGNFTESVVEQAALAWLESLGWEAKYIQCGHTTAR